MTGLKGGEISESVKSFLTGVLDVPNTVKFESHLTSVLIRIILLQRYAKKIHTMVNFYIKDSSPILMKFYRICRA